MAWPTPIVRLVAELSMLWDDAKPEVDEELDQLVEQTNKILDEGQVQEARITAHMADVDAHAISKLFPPISLVIAIGGDVDSDIRVTADAILMADGETILEGVDVTGDIYDSPATGSGGLETGLTPAIDAFYFIWLVSKAAEPHDPVVVFSSSRTNPDLTLLDAEYTAKKPVGVMRTIDNGSGSAKILPFVHDGDYYLLLPDDPTYYWGAETRSGTTGYDVDLSGIFPEGCKLAEMAWSSLAAQTLLVSPGPGSHLHDLFANYQQHDNEVGAGVDLRQVTVPLDGGRLVKLKTLNSNSISIWPIGYYWRP